MNYLNTTVNWEEFFIQEALELEEKMKNFDHSSLDKPKLLIALESNILKWTSYETWFCAETGCCSFKSSISEQEISHLIVSAKDSVDIYSNHGIWDEQLIPLMTWNDHIYVLGLHYPTKLMALKNHVFILTPPHILQLFSKNIFDQPELETEVESDSKTYSILEGLDFNISAPSISFGKQDKGESERTAIWEFISERHEEFSFEAKKHFSAFMVLRIENSKTKVFKMDSDLEKDGINSLIFEYNLNDENPFKKVYQTGSSESFSLTQLGIGVNNFKYACITALKRGDTVVGFLVGFKAANLSEKDTTLLEDLAKESA